MTKPKSVVKLNERQQEIEDLAKIIFAHRVTSGQWRYDDKCHWDAWRQDHAFFSLRAAEIFVEASGKFFNSDKE